MTIDKFIGSPRFNGSSIIYNAVVTKHFEEGTRVDVETFSLDFHNDGFIFANEFLDVVNKTFGTDYDFDPSYKNEVGKKHGNINMHKDFALRGSYGGAFELLHHYDYDDVRGCCSTYGDYTKEVLLAFADAVDAYNNGDGKKTSDFHPDYKDETELNKVKQECDESAKAINAEIDKAIDALKLTMEGQPLENASRAVRAGYHWTLSSIRDKERDAERNNYLDGMERVANVLKSHIKRFKDYFDLEVFNTKRKIYYSTDDRCHAHSGLRYDEKNGNESYFTIEPYEVESGSEIRFKFEGWVEVKKWREDPIRHKFDLYGLTFEELLIVNDQYNELYRVAKWGK